MFRSAEFSPCRSYRYALRRIWQPELPRVLFIGLNPSTADEQADDPTVRRCLGFARSWGFGGLLVANLFAYRATRPKDLLAAEDPLGPDNDLWLARLADEADMAVAAWGNHGRHLGRWVEASAFLGDLYCLGVTCLGQPRHPLYTRRDLRPLRWQPEAS